MGGTQTRSPGGGGHSPSGVANGGHRGTAAPRGSRKPGGAAPLHLAHRPTHQGGHPRPGCRPRRRRPRLPLRRLRQRRPTRARRLVVQRVARAVVWAGGGGCCCCVRGLVMQFSLVAAGGGVLGRARRRGAGAVAVGGCLRMVSRCWGPCGGGGQGGRLGVAPPGGVCRWVLCRLGVWVSCRALWVVSVYSRRVMRLLAGRGVALGGGCLGFWEGLRFAGRLAVLVGRGCG